MARIENELSALIPFVLTILSASFLGDRAPPGRRGSR